MTARALRHWWSRTIAVVLGVVLLTGCSSFDGAYDLPLPGHEVDADEAFEVTAYFRDVLNVVPRSPIMVDDVVVGEVGEVERAGWNARITLLIREDIKLPDNVIADIRQVSLLGEKYVALESPTEQQPTGRLADGDTIELAATGRNPEVEEVLGALSFLLSGGGVAQLGSITEEANQVMSGREDRLKGLLSSLDSVVGTLDDQKLDTNPADVTMPTDGAVHTLRSLADELRQMVYTARLRGGPAIANWSFIADTCVMPSGRMARSVVVSLWTAPRSSLRASPRSTRAPRCARRSAGP